MDFDPYALFEPTAQAMPEPLPVSDVDAGQLVMPFYLICDISGSMSRHMKELNRSLNELFSSIARNPIIDDTVMVSVITFDHNAQVAVPLSAPSEGSVPELRSAGGTSYAAAWACYATAVAEDYDALKAEGAQFFRPCVFFLTDGDDLGSNWQEVFQAYLGRDFDTGVGNPMYPFVVSFGFGDASIESLSALAYPPQHPNVSKPGRWYLAAKTGPGEMLKAIIPMIAQSVVNSGMSAAPAADGRVTPSVELDDSWLRGSHVVAGHAGLHQVDAVF